jgi:hypothetical protein
LANNEHDRISRIQLLEEYPSSAAYVSGAQGECQNSHQKNSKYEKQHGRHVKHGTHDPTTLMHKTHGQKYTNLECSQTQNVAGIRRVLATAVDDWSENLIVLAPVRAYAYVQ